MNKKFENIMNEWFEESFVLTEDKKLRKDYFVDRQRNKISDVMCQKFDDKDASVLKNAEEIGINPNYDEAEAQQFRTDNTSRNGNLKAGINKEVRDVLKILRNYTSEDGKVFLHNLKSDCENGVITDYSYSEILKIKDFIDLSNLTYLYDVNRDVPSVKKSIRFGMTKDTVNDRNIDNVDMRDSGSIAATVNKYVANKYGIEFTCPTFSNKNLKVQDALLINFESAYRCAAWNECLVKHACYARSGEQARPTVKYSNDKKHLMWLTAMDDPELFKMVKGLLRAYVIDYSSVIQDLKSNNSEFIMNQPQDTSLYGEKMIDEGVEYNDDIINDITEKDFAELPEDVIEVIKNHLNVHDIRLNENGDFINQNFLEQFDKIAEDFRIVGVNTAAYCCRNLNFKNIKNIIINASRLEMNGPSIARYFYAVPEKMYDAFPNTYENMSITTEPDAIKKLFLPLVDANGVKNGNFYYKCPCGRDDFDIEVTNDAKGSKKKLSSINCYQCHLCYQQPSEEVSQMLNETGGKLFVFVKAHGTNADLLNKERAKYIADNVGVAEGYELDSQVNSGIQDKTINEMMEMMNPSSIPVNMENEAYDVIATNAISSMSERFSGQIEEEPIMESKKPKTVILNEAQFKKIMRYQHNKNK